MQAVNCVVRRGDRLIGENTDGKGFVAGAPPTTGPARIRGHHDRSRWCRPRHRRRACGRRDRPAPHRQPRHRTRRTTSQRSWALHSRQLRVEATSLGDHYRIPASTDVLINATSVGLYPNVDAELPLDLRDLRPGCHRCRRRLQSDRHALAPTCTHDRLRHRRRCRNARRTRRHRRRVLDRSHTRPQCDAQRADRRSLTRSVVGTAGNTTVFAPT